MSDKILKKFIVEIRLETPKMQTSDDVIDALEDVIADIRDLKFGECIWADSGSISDYDGKYVGEWRLEEE